MNHQHRIIVNLAPVSKEKHRNDNSEKSSNNDSNSDQKEKKQE